MGNVPLRHFQFTVDQSRGVCGGIGWSVEECFGINKTDFSKWWWKDADGVRVRLFRVSVIQPLAWNIWINSSTSGSVEGTRLGLIDIIPINSIKITKPQLIATLTGQIDQKSIRRSWWLANLTSLCLQLVRSNLTDSVREVGWFIYYVLIDGQMYWLCDRLVVQCVHRQTNREVQK